MAWQRVSPRRGAAGIARSRATCAWLMACAALAHPASASAHLPADGMAVADRLAIEPVAAVVLVILAVIHARGQWRVRQRTGPRGVRRLQAGCFWSGWLALAAALGPPIERLSGVSFAAHMVQHELLMLVAAPLMVLARPIGILVWGLPAWFARGLVGLMQSRSVRRAAAWLSVPLAAWIVHALVLWGWHAPAAFDSGLASDPVHWLQHASFFAAAAIFWWSVLAHDAPGGRRGVALLSIFTTAIHMTVLGMLLTTARSVWYAGYRHGHNPWGLTALEDQQLGGLIMWVPGGAVLALAGVAVMARWLRELEARTSPP